MNYHEIVQMYFERSVALQWYWTVYILVIGGILGFSTFRQRPELVTVILVTVLYGCFAYKNLGAIEATTLEREALLTAMKEYPAEGTLSADVTRVRKPLEPTLVPATVNDVRYFHIACDLMIIIILWAKEWQRRKHEAAHPTA